MSDFNFGTTSLGGYSFNPSNFYIPEGGFDYGAAATDAFSNNPFSIDVGVTPFANTAVGSTGNVATQPPGNTSFLGQLGQFAKDITPLLGGVGGLIESIKGVPPGQRRFAGAAQAANLDMIARSLGYTNGEDLLTSGRKPDPIEPVVPSETVATPESVPTSVIKGSDEKAPMTKYDQETIQSFIGEGGDPEKMVLGMPALRALAETSGMTIPQAAVQVLDNNLDVSPNILSGSMGDEFRGLEGFKTYRAGMDRFKDSLRPGS